MTFTVKDIIESIAEEVGILRASEPLAALPTNRILRAVNMLIGSWSAENLMALAYTEVFFPLVAGKFLYSIGTGGDFNTPKPLDIAEARTIDASGINRPLDIESKEQWNAHEDVLYVTAPPEKLAFDAMATQEANPLGNIYLYPNPDNSTTYILLMRMQTYLTGLVNVGDNITFPDQYYRALVFNGAKEVWGKYHNENQDPVPASIMSIARESKRTIETLNRKLIVAGVELPRTKRGNYDIYSDRQYG
jgi:hypothetical protein